MREVSFKNLPALGPGDAPSESALLAEFLLTTPVFAHALRSFGVVPPIHILNEVLSSGSYDAGMSGGASWEPFEVSAEEYEELVEQLTTSLDHSIIEDPELWDRSTYEKWHGALLSKYARGRSGES